MELRLSGRLKAADDANLSGLRIEADFLQVRRTAPVALAPKTDAARIVELKPTPKGRARIEAVEPAAANPVEAAQETVRGQAAALVSEDGAWTLVLPDRDDLRGDNVHLEVFSSKGLRIGDRDVGLGTLDKTIEVNVTPPPPTDLAKPAEPAVVPETRRVQGRVIERRGLPLPASMQVLLLGKEKVDKKEDPHTPILVARADGSGYFAGRVRNREYVEVVAVVSGIPADVPIELENSLVPPRIPIVVDLSARAGGLDVPGVVPALKDPDCGCPPGTSLTPRTPTQENIADAPGEFSVDLGTGDCIKFNVPNRAIEEFSFYSVVRTTEPHISGVATGSVVDDAVILPTPPPPPPDPTGPDEASLVVLLRLALAPLVATELASPLGALALANGGLSDSRWATIEASCRDVVTRVGGRALPQGFFASLREQQQFVVNLGGLFDGGNQVRELFDGIVRAVAAAAARGAQGQGVATAAYAAKAAPSQDISESIHKLDPKDIYALKDLAERPPGRLPLDTQTPVDWDTTPTIYEATSIAHGHVLHYKQIWYADGYSLGDLLYSLPLAPGQKKLVSVIDWERRETTTRDEFTSAGEGLSADINRSRDLTEVVSGMLSEAMRGGSSNTTTGFAAGGGAAGNGTYQGMNFGALVGVSGGIGSSTSDAFQASGRELAGSTLQSIRDQTLQSASAARNLRSTIVQTAAQGEAVRASSEVVANHNHCHALTIQYFEVLRHLKVTSELVDVQECLFVPLPMAEFGRAKTLRWRQPLATYLQRPELAAGFDATRRVATNWQETDSPVGRYADELVSAVFGDLTLTLYIPLPPFPEKPPPDPADAAAAAEKVSKALMPTEGALGVLLAIATGGASLIAGATVSATTDAVKATTEGAKSLAGSMVNLSPEERYAKFQHDVMPSVAAGFVDRLEVFALKMDGSEVKLDGVDFTLVSEYQPGTPLPITLRGRVSNPVARSELSALVIKAAAPLPTGCRAIINSATLRYQTRGFRHELMSDSRVNDDIDLPLVAYSGPDPLSSLPLPPAPPLLPPLLSLLPPGFPPGYSPPPNMTPVSGGAGATLYTPLDEWEQRAPRREDVRLSAELIEHLNANLEYYHRAIWWTMDANRRYMLLDGYEAPNAGGRSVASVVENNVIGIVGNALVFPVAAGLHLDPQFNLVDGATLLEQYDPQSAAPPSRISLPTRGVFAEAVMGDCNACEQIDDTRFWRWDEVPIDEPPALDMSALASRRSEPAYGTPTSFPTPIVGMQTPPAAPEATSMNAILDALGKQSFTDITGLTGTQANAAAALAKAMDTALAYGQEASKLAQAASATKNIGQTMRAIDGAADAKKIDEDKAKQLRGDALGKMTGSTGALSPDDAAKRLKMIGDLEAAGSITPEAAKAANRTVLDAMNGADGVSGEQHAVEELIPKLDPNNVTRLQSGATVIDVGYDPNAERKAPTHIRGVSGLGKPDGEGTTTMTQLLEAGKALLEAAADGVQDAWDAPDKSLTDAVAKSIFEAAKSAADDATDKIPYVKAVKVAVTLSKVFADAVGDAIVKIDAQNRQLYSVAELAGGGSDGLTQADYDAIRYSEAWMANNAMKVGSILTAGFAAVADEVVGVALKWLSAAAIGAVSDVAKQLVKAWAGDSRLKALIGKAVADKAVGAGKDQLDGVRDAATYVIRVYIQQFVDADLRKTIEAPAAMGAKKPKEKVVLTGLAALAIDPAMRTVDPSVADRLRSEMKKLVTELRQAQLTVTAGPIGADASGVTLPATLLASIEQGPTEAAALASAQLSTFRLSMIPITATAQRLSFTLGSVRQRGLVTSAESDDSEANAGLWNAYAEELNGIGRSWERAAKSLLEGMDGQSLATARSEVENLGFMTYRLNPDNQRGWERIAYVEGVYESPGVPWAPGTPPLPGTIVASR